jgi:hypothetical protein
MARLTFDCFGTSGDKLRVGVQSLKRILTDLRNITDIGPDCYALVSCPDAGLYLGRLFDQVVLTIVREDAIIDKEVKLRDGINEFLTYRKECMQCLE